RYLLFEKSSDLPRIGIAAARAEGFLTPPALPALGRRPLLRRPGGRSRPPHGSGQVPRQQSGSSTNTSSTR
ncbi:hypothetical protein ABZW44_50085, partial [Streptomyces mirabilis]